MKRITLILFAFACGCWLCRAQDKIHTVTGETYESKVISVDDKQLKMDPVTVGGTVVSKLPVEYVTSIEFEDGFCLPFIPHGGPRRAALAAAPVSARGGGIYAERIFRLTDDELLDRFGEKWYWQDYKPAKNKQTVGYAELFSGIVLFGTCAVFDNPSRAKGSYKEVWFRNDRRSILFRGTSIQNSSPLTLPGRVINSGKLNPYTVTGEFLSAVTLVSGLTNVLTAGKAIKSAASCAESSVARSVGRTRGQYWAGLGMAVAGAGALVGGCIDLNNHKYWYIEHNPDPRYEMHEGDMPIAGPILAFAGSVLLNVGITEFTVASTRLKGYGGGHEARLAVNAGLCPGGYGLLLSF